MLSLLQSNEALPDVEMELPVFQFMPIASCPIAQHREELGSILLTPTLQTLIYTGMVNPGLCLDEELHNLVRLSLN